ncbi:MAG: hypothetical protein QUS12_15225, partial [Methanosarcina sp.]|nr:hypothetical protein [Methanosarcina sp.]
CIRDSLRLFERLCLSKEPVFQKPVLENSEYSKEIGILKKRIPDNGQFTVYSYSNLELIGKYILPEISI